MTEVNEKLERQSIIEGIIKAVTAEQHLLRYKNESENDLVLFDVKGNLVATVYSIDHCTVTAFVKALGAALAENLI